MLLSKRIWIAAALIPAALWTMRAEAQWEVGPHVLVSFGQADSGSVSGTGGGLGIKVTHGLWGLSWLGLRGDFGYVSFGSDQRLADIGGFAVLVESRNESFRLSFGPQVRLKLQRLQVYGNANFGVYNYRTVLTVPTFSTVPLTQTTDSLTEFGWGIGGGLLYNLGFGPWLDIGLQRLTIRNAETMQVNGRPVKSNANEFDLTLGVVFFL